MTTFYYEMNKGFLTTKTNIYSSYTTATILFCFEDMYCTLKVRWLYKNKYCQVPNKQVYSFIPNKKVGLLF